MFVCVGGGGVQFVISSVNPRTTEVRSVCARLSGRRFVQVPRESQAPGLHSDQELTFCLFAAPQRRHAGSPLGPLFWGVYSPCRSAAGLEPAPLSDGRVDLGGMENDASKDERDGGEGGGGRMVSLGLEESNQTM